MLSEQHIIWCTMVGEWLMDVDHSVNNAVEVSKSPDSLRQLSDEPTQLINALTSASGSPPVNHQYTPVIDSCTSWSRGRADAWTSALDNPRSRQSCQRVRLLLSD
jgi:hypothetical protein